MKEGAAMLRGLGDLRRKVKTWLVFNKHSNVVMLDPLATFQASADAGAAMAMMADTVHLKAEGYKAVASKCKQLITDWLLRKKRKAAAAAAEGQEAKKIRLEKQGAAAAGSSGGQASSDGRKSNQPTGKAGRPTSPL
jgi:hypothetical protein